MSDYLIKLGQMPVMKNIVKGVGLPTPRPLRRADGAYADQPLQGKTVVQGGGGFATKALTAILEQTGAQVVGALPEGETKVDALVFDASGAQSVADLKAVYTFFNPATPRLAPGGRVLIVAALPEAAGSVAAAAVARAMEGFTRSLAKEVGKRGATANLLYVESGAAERLAMPARFFLTPHSAYVDGQPLRVTAQAAAPASDSLRDKVALVTGGARGIGAATARRLAAEGAKVVCLDIPADAETLDKTCAEIGGIALPLDITDDETPAKIAAFFQERFGGVDVVVHNAGVTRDKTVSKMPEHYWDMVMAINLDAILRVDEKLLGDGVLRDGGRIVCLSSIGGIAGNVGQTNYGLTKAGLIGYVAAQAPRVAARGITVNAVAPGFIETRMTAAMPFMIREAGRRMNSLSQGGQPRDVAEAIVFLSTPGACGISGQTLRVCGQSLIGA